MFKSLNVEKNFNSGRSMTMVNIKDADEEGVGSRGDSHDIIFGETAKLNQVKLNDSVEDGDDVTLKRGDQHILVNSIKLIEHDRYTGVIKGFENPIEIQSGNLKVGDTIRFNHHHIFTCSKRS